MRGLLATAIGALAATATAASSNITCATGLYMLCARGSGEANQTAFENITNYSGTPGYMAGKIALQIPGSVISGVVYPATDPLTLAMESQATIDPTELKTLNLTGYYHSENNGTTTLMQDVIQYHAACPDTKIALLGYSQGAQVVRDALCGGIGGPFNSDAPLSPALVNNNVIAVALMGDPTHIANQTIDRGNSTHNGIFTRTNTTVCQQYNSITASWCYATDAFCDSGDNLGIHATGYLTDATPEVVQFVVDRWTNSTSKSANATGSASPSASAPATGTSTGSAKSSPSQTGSASGLVQDQGLLSGAIMMLIAALSLF